MQTAVLTPDELKDIRESASNAAKNRRRKANKELGLVIGVARPNLIGRLDEFMQANMDARDFALSRKWTLASSSAYKDFTQDANKLRLFSDIKGSTFPSQQPSGEVFAINELAIFVNNSTKSAALEELLNKFGVRINYGDGRKPFEVPFRRLAKVSSRTPNCGNNTTTPIEGTRTEIIELGNELKLDPEDYIVIGPGDTTYTVEGFWLTDYATTGTAAPAGSETAIDVHVMARGRLYKSINRE